MKSIHVATARRLLLGWLCVSLLIGGASYWYGLRQLGQQLIEQAKGEGEKVTPAVLSRINGSAAQRGELQNLLASHAMEGFMMLALHDRDGRLVARKLAPGANPVLAEVRRRGLLPLGRTREFQSDYFERGGQGVIRIMMPLVAEGRLAGHIEAIWAVPSERVAQLEQRTRQSLLLVLLVVSFTTLLLYPFIVSLDRKVRAHAQQILIDDLELVAVLGSALEQRDSDTNLHNLRVTVYSLALAERVGLPRERVRELMAGAFLHDIGKIGVPDAILHKEGALTELEFAQMKLHVSRGLAITEHSAWLRLARDVIAGHHERFDGSGYPQGLAGEAIPLTARLFAIADVFDALSSRRPYKEAFALERSLELMQQEAGSHFDPSLLAAFVAIAPALHARVRSLDREGLENELKTAIPRYWDLV